MTDMIPQTQMQWVGFFVWLFVEYWLGRTPKVKAASIIELVTNIVHMVWTKSKEIVMLEGKELEKQLGEYGSVSVDVTPDLKVRVVLEAHIDLVAEIEKLAAKTSTPLDDQAMAWIKLLIKKTA